MGRFLVLAVKWLQRSIKRVILILLGRITEENAVEYRAGLMYLVLYRGMYEKETIYRGGGIDGGYGIWRVRSRVQRQSKSNGDFFGRTKRRDYEVGYGKFSEEYRRNCAVRPFEK